MSEVTRHEHNELKTTVHENYHALSKDIKAESAQRKEDTRDILSAIDRLKDRFDNKTSTVHESIEESRRPPYQLLGLCFTLFAFVISLVSGVYVFMEAKVDDAHEARHESVESSTEKDFNKTNLRIDTNIKDFNTKIENGDRQLDEKIETTRASLSTSMIERDNAIKSELTALIQQADNSGRISKLEDWQSDHDQRVSGINGRQDANDVSHRRDIDHNAAAIEYVRQQLEKKP